MKPAGASSAIARNGRTTTSAILASRLIELVRLDDGNDHLPAEPGAGEELHPLYGPARGAAAAGQQRAGGADLPTLDGFPHSGGDDTAAIVPGGLEVATRPTDEAPEVIFTTDEKQLIVPPVLTQVRRDDEFNKNYLPRMGVEIFYAFIPAPAACRRHLLSGF